MDIGREASATFARLVERLAEAGCVAPEDEAEELLAAAGGDKSLLWGMAARRVVGEPLAWITGGVVFAGRWVIVHPGVYVPRWQSEWLARRALQLLADDGVAVDLCTGSGAIAAVLAAARPGARVCGTELDEAACRCARANGVTVYQGDMETPLPAEVIGKVEVITAVVPYVPTDELEYLPRDVLAYEPVTALNGGPGGLQYLQRAAQAATWLLQADGTLLLEAGGSQDVQLEPALRALGLTIAARHHDEDGDLRGLEIRRVTG
jgi:release factor glutamine methyltransferase